MKFLQNETEDENQNESNSDDEKNESDRLYRPPKLVPIYNGNEKYFSHTHEFIFFKVFFFIRFR